MRTPERLRPAGVIRCAVYTRKSSEDGLEQEFNSLDAQREACEAYIVSQRHAGWVAVPEMFDDGGLSGGTLERPALRRLLGEVTSGRVKVIVVYKVDRLTRSLADFAKIVDVLDAQGASFVSVTQQFNTTTSMGRLTLNMLLSFAQFEREIAGERIRDKIAASKAKGMWMGGHLPLGCDVRDRKLVVNDTEAETVRLIFRRYGELGSVALLRLELDHLGIVSKRRNDSSGRCSGGKQFSRGALYLLLQNRIYLGEIVHRGKAYPGQHAAIVDSGLWRTVLDRLCANRQEGSLRTHASAPSLLAGLIFDGDSNRMTPSHAVKAGKRYRYYVSATLVTGNRRSAPGGRRVPAGDIEALMLDRLRAFFGSAQEICDGLEPFKLDAPTQHAALERSAQMARQSLSHSGLEARQLVQSLVTRVVIESEVVAVELDRRAVLSCLAPDWTTAGPQTPRPEPITLTIAARLRRAGKGMRLVIGADTAKAADRELTRLIARAMAIRSAVIATPAVSTEAIAMLRNVKRDRLSVLLRLSTLAPHLVRAILDGRQPVELTVSRLMSLSKNLPLDWHQQGPTLGFPAE